LGWPDNYKNGVKSGDLKKFHPTDVLETGYEILTLWVSRMIMMSMFALGESPFKTVYLHGMILDANGKKMSKSKGNGVDPLDMIASFGADASRLSLLMGFTPGNDSRFSEDKVEAKRNFINKLWNISRFILTTVDDKILATDTFVPIPKTEADKWILGEMADLIKKTGERLDIFDFSIAAEELTDFTWNKLADWYLEMAKIEKNKEEILIYILKNLLILWHPFIPFVTEKIWESFNDDLLMVAKWPDPVVMNNKKESEHIKLLQEIVIAIRNARSENKIEPSKKINAVIFGREKTEWLVNYEKFIVGLKTGLSSVKFLEKGEKIESAIPVLVGGVEIYLLVEIDGAKDRERLLKEKSNLEKVISLQKQKLANAEFITKAPEKIVSEEKNKLARYEADLEKINKTI
jgi:valyl-tRNA synthetase